MSYASFRFLPEFPVEPPPNRFALCTKPGQTMHRPSSQCRPCATWAGLAVNTSAPQVPALGRALGLLATQLQVLLHDLAPSLSSLQARHATALTMSLSGPRNPPPPRARVPALHHVVVLSCYTQSLDRLRLRLRLPPQRLAAASCRRGSCSGGCGGEAVLAASLAGAAQALHDCAQQLRRKGSLATAKGTSTTQGAQKRSITRWTTSSSSTEGS